MVGLQNYIKNKPKMEKKKDFNPERHCRLNWIEYTLMLYIFGRLINEVKELWQQGPRDY